MHPVVILILMMWYIAFSGTNCRKKCIVIKTGGTEKYYKVSQKSYCSQQQKGIGLIFLIWYRFTNQAGKWHSVITIVIAANFTANVLCCKCLGPLWKSIVPLQYCYEISPLSPLYANPDGLSFGWCLSSFISVLFLAKERISFWATYFTFSFCKSKNPQFLLQNTYFTKNSINGSRMPIC